jgi:hypothetical protein
MTRLLIVAIFFYIKRLSIFRSLRILNFFTGHSMMFQLFYRIILPTESKTKQSEDKKSTCVFLLSRHVALKLPFLLFDDLFSVRKKEFKNNNMSTSSHDQHETKTVYFTPAIALKYANTIFSSPLHTEWISSLIYDLLQLQPGHKLVDMGCGPGLESRAILDKMKNEIHVIGKYRNVSERLTIKQLGDYIVVHSI